MEFFRRQSYCNVTDKYYKLNIVLLIVRIAESNHYSSYIILFVFDNAGYRELQDYCLENRFF